MLFTAGSMAPVLASYMASEGEEPEAGELFMRRILPESFQGREFVRNEKDFLDLTESCFLTFKSPMRLGFESPGD